MIQMLIEQKLVSQKRKACHANYRRRKYVSFLRHKILRPVIFTHRKSRYVRAHRREWVGGWTAAIHVAEIQGIRARKIVIQSQSKLIVILHQRLGIDESVRSIVGQRKKWQHLLRRWIDGREERQLVEWYTGSEICELPLRIAAKAGSRVNGGVQRCA